MHQLRTLRWSHIITIAAKTTETIRYIDFQIDMDSSGNGAVRKNEGSWIPLILVMCAMLMRWLYYSDGNLPIQARRWFKARVCQFS